MKEDSVQKVVNLAINNVDINPWQILLLIILANAVAAFFGAYLKEKAKASATKEDIESITQKIESIKSVIQKNNEIDSTKYKLKYEACLASLVLIDAHLSHLLISQESQEIVKQYAFTKEARECHSKLILACENTELIELFNRIMFGPTDSTQENTPPTDLLNNYRNLIRKELGFGDDLPLDRERAWFGKLVCEKQND